MEKKHIKIDRAWARWTIGGMIVFCIMVYAFSFIVYEGNTVVVTRFGAPKEVVREAGLHLKLPWPFEKAYTFDRRQHYYDTSFIETLTNDKKNVILQTYVVWNIEDALKFLQSTASREAAEANLDSLVTNSKNGVLGKYNLSALVSTNKNELKLDEIESEILSDVSEQALNRYGIKVTQIGMKKLGLPEANMQYVFEQMRSERLKYVEQIKAEGERDASIIRNEADVQAAKLKSEGVNEAAKIKGEAELEAAKVYADAQKEEPDFYSFLRKLDSAEKLLGDKATVIFRNDSAPFDVLNDKK
ncbi:membrane protease subunit HflC [Ruminiclostridium sufflavum DSM 19573]|uniref:Protein HflC n=1 Tax=Ruminiclostridium sufflavum DSM 19573 TaxID=1121337 RepID=A0A318XQ27_9FIRM|nr:protease modulator HflC [Ruminiclostridium sufflavum]PYG90175.1 membrane protease subunit HflC [Ruminiclostridium sufflavum DSM 19573]